MDRIAKRILVVDDEIALLKIMSVYLARLGHPVVACATTGQAWSEFTAAPADFAVAVLDASMPGPGYVELATRMLGGNSRLSVIVSSGYALDMTAVEAFAPGRTMFLQKPYTSDMLMAAVRRMLAAQEEEL